MVDTTLLTAHGGKLFRSQIHNINQKLKIETGGINLPSVLFKNLKSTGE